MYRRGPGLWNNRFEFPLERLYMLIEHGIWSDDDSEGMWLGQGPADSRPTVYQLWESNPVLGGELYLQHVIMTCVWCGYTGMIPLRKFTHTHTTKTAKCQCPSCEKAFNADTLSAKFFRDDICTYLKLHNPWLTFVFTFTNLRIVKGAITGVLDPTPEETAKADLGISLEVILHKGEPPQNLPPTRPHLAIYISSAANPTWNDLLSSFQKTTEEMKAARLFRLLSRPAFLNSLRIAYMGIMWPDFSIDLVAASLRQREFTKKITSEELREIDTPTALFRAIIRYHKFLLLIRRRLEKKKKVCSCPDSRH